MSNIQKQELDLSIETIAFQDGKLGFELESFIADIRKKYSNKKEFIDSKSSGQISAIIKKHTKILVNIDIDYMSEHYNCGPAIELPRLTNNHIFIENYIKPYLDTTTSERFIKLIYDNKGKNGVNLKTSEVFGVFTDIETTMLIENKYLLDAYLTPAEVTAIILHELGHLFTYFEYMSRTVTTNQTLASLYNGLSDEKTNEEKQGIIQLAAKALSVEQELGKEFLPEDDARKTVIKLMRICSIKSEAGSDKYDEASCEVLADQFATKHGYGLSLATAFSKLNNESMSRSKVTRAAMYISETFDVMSSLSIGSVVTGAAVTNAVGLAVGVFSGVLAFAVLSLVLTTFSTTANSFYLYDPFPTRLKKIREQLVQSTRQTGNTKLKIGLLLDQIKAIDALIKYSVDTSFLLNTIADFIRPFNKSPAANIALNRRLEELASNDLFVSAAKLKTLL